MTSTKIIIVQKKTIYLYSFLRAYKLFQFTKYSKVDKYVLFFLSKFETLIIFNPIFISSFIIFLILFTMHFYKISN